jgi:hypothetical protein
VSESGIGELAPHRQQRLPWWLRGFVLDLRSLALFRVALGCCLFADLVLRTPQIDDFYTDDGVLPREALVLLSDPWALSLHFISGEWAVQLFLFLATAVLATGFILGYRTRLCTVGVWVLVVSMHVRNPLVVHGGDGVLRLLLFWSIFLPLNGRCSADRALNRSAPPLPDRHLSPAGVALIFQMCAIYWFAFASKTDPTWLTERSAIYYALNLDMLTTSAGRSLLQYPELLHRLTTATMVLEIAGPILALSPVFTTPLRLAAVGLFTGFHAGLGVAMTLVLFPWICVAGWMALLPGPLWDRFGRGLEGPLVPGLGRLIARLEALGVTAPRPRETGILGSLLVLAALLTVSTSLLFKSPRLPGLAPSDLSYRRRIYSLTGLGQQWRMFAPRPTTEDGWYVLEGVKRDGTRIDLWTGQPPSYTRPEEFQAVYPSNLWLEYLYLLWNREYAPFRVYMGRYLCRTWNDAHPESEVTRVILRFMLERTPPEGQPVPPPTRERVARHYCFDDPEDR